MSALAKTLGGASGGDFFWARELPRTMAAMELDEVAAEGDFPVFRGGSPMAEFFSLTAEQMRESIVRPGTLDEAGLDEALALLTSPDFWGFGGGVSVWGRRKA
jgi:hypothetical protein